MSLSLSTARSHDFILYIEPESENMEEGCFWFLGMCVHTMYWHPVDKKLHVVQPSCNRTRRSDPQCVALLGHNSMLLKGGQGEHHSGSFPKDQWSPVHCLHED